VLTGGTLLGCLEQDVMDEEASLVTKLQGYTEGYYQLAIYFNCGFTTK
jgi:hypothetical protein